MVFSLLWNITVGSLLTSLIDVADTMGIIPLRGIEFKDVVTIGAIADRNICPCTNKDLHFPSSNVYFA